MKFLIVKTSSLGDILHAFPALAYLREKFPNAEIDWVVEKPFSQLLQSHPAIDDVFCIDTKKWRQMEGIGKVLKEIVATIFSLRKKKYDVVFDLQGNIKSGIVTFFTKGKCKVGFGRKSLAEWPNQLLFRGERYNPSQDLTVRESLLYMMSTHFSQEEMKVDFGKEQLLEISDKERLWIKKLFSEKVLKGSLCVVVCPGSAWENKQMDIQALINFLEKITAFNSFFLFVWGSEKEFSISKEIQEKITKGSYLMEKKLRLPVLQNVIAQADLLIGMDSLPLHLCGTTNTPSYSIFGPSMSSRYKPFGEKHEAFQGMCPYGKSFDTRCPILRTCATGACIKKLSGDEVFESFKKWWNRLLNLPS